MLRVNSLAYVTKFKVTLIFNGRVELYFLFFCKSHLSILQNKLFCRIDR